ncbi:unnamed protein product [Prunus armeniaca]|uniref:Uncharacterized protein n=1 Tax=Prunus armeniaca TaxID=36596 RepID=A0A6J5XJI7_PRUAR|nr:unnamed protein product [Prunus armeniaca]
MKTNRGTSLRWIWVAIGQMLEPVRFSESSFSISQKGSRTYARTINKREKIATAKQRNDLCILEREIGAIKFDSQKIEDAMRTEELEAAEEDMKIGEKKTTKSLDSVLV